MKKAGRCEEEKSISQTRVVEKRAKNYDERKRKKRERGESENEKERERERECVLDTHVFHEWVQEKTKVSDFQWFTLSWSSNLTRRTYRAEFFIWIFFFVFIQKNIFWYKKVPKSKPFLSRKLNWKDITTFSHTNIFITSLSHSFPP